MISIWTLSSGKHNSLSYDGLRTKHEDVAVISQDSIDDARLIHPCQLGFGLSRCLAKKVSSIPSDIRKKIPT